jgi:hypothetical protein
MSTDLFEKLAELPVPPVPERLRGEVHKRLNAVLTVGHVVDFAASALPAAAWELCRPLAFWLSQSLGASAPAAGKDAAGPAAAADGNP